MMKRCPESSESVEIGLEPDRRGHQCKIRRRTRETGRLGKHACSGVRYSRRAETPRAVIGATRGVDGERMNGTGIDRVGRRRLRWRPRRLRHGREEGAPGSGEKWRSAQGRLGGLGPRHRRIRRATDKLASRRRCDASSPRTAGTGPTRDGHGGERAPMRRRRAGRSVAEALLWG